MLETTGRKANGAYPKPEASQTGVLVGSGAGTSVLRPRRPSIVRSGIINYWYFL